MNLRRMVEFNFLRQLSKERKEDDSGLVSPSSQKKRSLFKVTTLDQVAVHI